MKNVLLAVLCGLLTLVTAGPAGAGGKILIVHSYHAEMPHIVSINKGLLSALKSSGAEIKYYYMDTKRRTSEKWKQEAGARAKGKMARFQTQVVITVDDAAQEYFAKHFAGKPGAPQFIFIGVNELPEKYGYPAPNVTGILGRPLFVQSVDFLHKVVPGLKKVAVVSADSPSGRAVVNYLKKCSPSIRVTGYHLAATFQEWKQIINRVRSEAGALAFPVYHSLVKSPDDRSPVEPGAVMAWSLDNFPGPILGFYDFVIADGALCGIVRSWENDGYDVGKMAGAILGQEKTAADFPMTVSDHGKVMINLRTAQKLGIAIPYDVIRLAQEVIK